MNTVQSALRQEIDKEVTAHGGLRGYQAHVLQNLELRTVVRESHATPIIQLAYNHTQPQLGNLVATVGADQATIYDDLHMGDHVGVVAHFTNARTEYHRGGALRALAWVACQGLTTHPEGDCWLAISGCDHVIQVLSVAESRVIRQLSGHTSQVVDLSSAAAAPGVLLSMSEGGEVRVWDVPRAHCLTVLDTGGTHTVELHPSGGWFLTGSCSGQLHAWDLSHLLPEYPTSKHQQAVLSNSTNTVCQVLHSCNSTRLPSCTASGLKGKLAGDAQHQAVVLLTSAVTESGSQAVDCIRFLPGDRVVVKTCSGAVSMWHIPRPPFAHQHNPVDNTACTTTAHNSTHHHQPCTAPTGAIAIRDGDHNQHDTSPQTATTTATTAAASLANQLIQLIWRLHIPDAATPPVYPSRCLLAVCVDGAYVCCGNNAGTVYVLDSTSGEIVQRAAADKVQDAVRTCGLSADCRHLWAALGNGFIFRFEYVHPDDRRRDVTPGPGQGSEAAGSEGGGHKPAQEGAGRKRLRDSSTEPEGGS